LSEPEQDPTVGGAGPAGRSGRSAEIAPSAPPARQARGANRLLLREGSEATVDRIAQLLDEPDWLRAERHEALRLAEDLPLETNPLFTSYIDLRAARFDEIEPFVEIGEAPNVSDTLPEGAAGVLVVSDDRIVTRGLNPAAQSAGVVFDTLHNALRQRPDLAAHARSLVEGGATLPENDKFAQLARALSTIGLFVHVPAGITLDGPLVIRWTAGQPGRGLVSRTLISLGEGAVASILEEQLPSVVATDGAQSLWWGTSEVVLADGASLDFAAQQDFGPNTVAFVNRHATLGQQAQLRWALASVGAQLHKSRIDNHLIGRGSEVHQAEIGFGGGSQLFDLTSYTRHVGEDTSGDLLSKGVFLDRSRGYFKGMIGIERSARGTDSFLGEFAMLLTKKARSVTIPSLEIDQPNVRRASHSSSVGPIDETQVFYLMSRGLPRELARKFIVLGFLEPVVARIPLAEAQDRLRELLEEKWPADSTVAHGVAA
jgi:Fe-S cluster assembly scaffold protein SufB